MPSLVGSEMCILDRDMGDFVTHEQALALKKLGFKERCYQHYNTKGVIQHNDVICNEVFQSVISSQLCQSHNNGVPKETCDAPTLAQAQKWLLKDKKRFVHVEPKPYENYKFIWFISSHNVPSTWDVRSHISYNSYEAALSASITECLKLLK